MPSYDIAGYSSIMYVKGQYYRVAADPKPVVFTGDIDDLSNPDDILRRAMKVTNGQVLGTLPSDGSTEFLIRTIQYGTDIYLQTAYASPSGREYKRIYAGEWTDWIGIDSEINNAKSIANSAASAASSAARDVSSLANTVSSLSGTVNSLKSNLQSVSNSVSTLNSTVSNKTTMTDVSNQYVITKATSGSNIGPWTFGGVSAKKVGNCVQMSLTFNHRRNDTVAAGTNGFKGTLTAPANLLPLCMPYIIGFWKEGVVICEIPTDGNNLQVRVLAHSISPQTDNPEPIVVTGMFMVSG